jgi:uncharacterized phage protein gp47/JayE
MATTLTFKTPDEVADEYLTHLQGLKPTVNRDQKDSDWYIRGKVSGGVVAGVYADQRLIANDAFPQRARHDAVGRFLQQYFNRNFNPGTPSTGSVKLTVTPGSLPLSIGSQVIHDPTGNVYQTTVLFTPDLVAPTGTVAVRSIATGQSQNLINGTTLRLASPPAGYQAAASVYGADMSDGRNPETDPEAIDAILLRIRSPIRGGSITDYEQWTFEADPSVTGASVSRYPNGLGTVSVTVSAGTTDIDSAIDNDEAIVFVPSDALMDIVQAYLDAKRPVTDCVSTLKVSLLAVNVTVHVRYANGTGTTIPSGQTLTQEELVIREVSRAIYKTPSGGRKIAGGTQGYVVAADIEESVDNHLSTGPYTIGTIPILDDRDVLDLSATGPNLAISTGEQPIPGTITVVEI